jgi:small subunit ribosomal protein S9
MPKVKKKPKVVKKKTKKKELRVKKKPKAKKAAVKVEKVKKEEKKPAKYFEEVGRRKTAVARVRLFTQGEKTFLVNDKPLKDYFPGHELEQIVLSPLERMNCLDKFRVVVKVKGGGFHAQAEAVRHGVSRALTLFNPDFRKKMKKAGFLTRDSRMRERKKFGLKRARRAPQWQKR